MDDLTVEQAREMIQTAEGLPDGPDGETAPQAILPDGDLSLEGDVAESPDFGNRSEENMGSRAYVESAVGLGVDIVEIARMEAILERSPAFAQRVFSEGERTYCEKQANRACHYALRFAAKEAVVKALGTGFAQGIGVRDIEVERASSGKPIARLSGRALEIANEQGVRDLAISLSYTHTDAVACAMAVTEASLRATEKRKDPMEELAKQFKEVRGILDDL